MGGIIIDHTQAQDFLVFLLNELLFFIQILSKLVKCMLDVLHVLFDSLDVDGSLWALVTLCPHRRARRVKVSTSLVKEGRLLR